MGAARGGRGVALQGVGMPATPVDPTRPVHYETCYGGKATDILCPMYMGIGDALEWIKREICRAFGRAETDTRALEGLRILDIGCGGGLLTEPLARMGADMVGADAGAANIEAARVHAAAQGLGIDWRATTAEALAADGERFDVVVAMEIVEHVADLPMFLREVAAGVGAGGRRRRRWAGDLVRRPGGETATRPILR